VTTAAHCGLSKIDMGGAVSLVVAPGRFFLFDAKSEKKVL
jgi:hypothetical protein